MPEQESTSLNINLPSVAETALATLWSRGLESMSRTPILDDAKAVKIMERLRPCLKQGSELARSLARDEVEPSMQTYVALRSRRMDGYARDHLNRHPNGMVVNLGCGLDTRRWRLDSENVLDLDLPEMIGLRRQLLGDQSVGADVLEHSWLETVRHLANGPILFLAEGLFMYLPKPALEQLVRKLAWNFPGGELAAEVFSSFWLTPPRLKRIRTRLADSIQRMKW